MNWIRVLRSQDQYLLLADRSVEKRDNKFTLQPLQATLATTVARAHLHAFDRHTGRAQWPVPAVVEDFSLFHDQPAEVPALTFFRQYQKQNRPPGSNWPSCVSTNGTGAFYLKKTNWYRRSKCSISRPTRKTSG